MNNALVLTRGGDAESATRTVKKNVPAVVGVPAIVPELLSVTPGGNDPAARLHEYEGRPPLALSVLEYGEATMPTASDAVDTETGGGAMVTERDLVPVPVGTSESATCTVNSNVPAVRGVPVIAPELLNVSPAGSDPD